MTREERQQKIDSYADGYDIVVEALEGFPAEMWQFKPAPDRWSIHEIVVHLADSEANAYVRCRRFIAEPGNAVMAYDQDAWAARLNYHQQSTEDALELFKWLRHTTFNLIRALPDAVWSNTATHPEHGSMSFERWLEIYEEHPRKHIAQMRQNHEAWKALQAASA